MAVYEKSFTIDRPQHLGSGKWVLENITDITILFGRNGSGKSQLLRLLRDQDPQSRHYASPERGGEIRHDPGHTEQEFDFSQRANKRKYNFAPTYREEVISRIGTYLRKRGNIRTRSVKMNPEELEKFVSLLLPNFQFSIPNDGALIFKMKRLIPNEQDISSVNDLSSGEAEVFTLALDLLTMSAIWVLEDKEKRFFLIDEPDTHLHPELQQHLAKFLLELVKKFKVQLLIATHSTTLLSALGSYGGDKTSIIYLNNSQEEQKAIRFDKELKVLTACLGGHALMGPLFSFPLLLVEGDDDYKIWSEAVRHYNLNLSVIPCEGSRMEKYKKKLESLFASMLGQPTKPSAFVIKDKDESEELTHDQSQLHVRTLKLNCRESENLYLTDKILEKIGTSWDQIKTKIQSDAQNFGNKSQKLLSLVSAERRDVDLKGLMDQLTTIIDPKRVDWRIRIGQVMGASRPDGELKEFLGENILNAFWEVSINEN